MSLAERNLASAPIDYRRDVSNKLRLVPAGGNAPDRPGRDYQGMVSDGLFLEQADSFGQLIEHCREIERKANAP